MLGSEIIKQIIDKNLVNEDILVTSASCVEMMQDAEYDGVVIEETDILSIHQNDDTGEGGIIEIN